MGVSDAGVRGRIQCVVAGQSRYYLVQFFWVHVDVLSHLYSVFEEVLIRGW